MKVKISIASLFIFIFVSSASFAQYKYDIGLKASSYEMERLQLESRFHLNNRYSIVVTLATGSRSYGSSSQTSFYSDSLFDLTQNHFRATSNTLKIGIQRKLGFLASDVFYAGATIGFGHEQQQNRSYTATYFVQSDSTLSGSPYLYNDWNEISSSDDLNRTSAINAQLGISFGMDIPLTKRFSINAEIAFAGIYKKSLDYPQSFIDLQGNVSGGLRYSFGKRE
ncbi:MAG: hypothetical protein P8P74_00875 [Crocinitomicaceae bacterium]|nr:hypothetical protein [Crocinitomicaceae bacterium]